MEGLMSVVRFFMIFFAINFLIKFLVRMSVMKNQIFIKKNDEKLKEESLSEDQKDNEYNKIMEEMVYDEVNKVYLPKKEAYQIVEGEEKKYFSSWESRQQYIQEKNM